MSLDDVVDFCASNCSLKMASTNKKRAFAPREFNYADNCNSAKIYCIFPVIGPSEKIAQPLSTQSKLFKEF